MDFYAYAGNSPTNFNDPRDEDYTVKYDPTTNSVTVSADVGIYGDDASADLADSWQLQANMVWNQGYWKYGKCNVRFNFTLHFLPHFHQATSIGPQNIVFVTSSAPANILGITYTNFGYWWKGLAGQDLGHEIGHFLFLGDDYPQIMPQRLLIGSTETTIITLCPIASLETWFNMKLMMS